MWEWDKKSGRWWSQQWGDAVFSDPVCPFARGGNYAQYGTVCSWGWDGRTMLCKMDDREANWDEGYPPPLQLKLALKLPPIDPKVDDAFVCAALSNKTIFEGMRRKVLEPKLAEIAEMFELKLFPRFSELKLSCNCDHDERPCLHLAALLAQMEDFLTERPLRIFTLIGSKLEYEFERHKFVPFPYYGNRV